MIKKYDGYLFYDQLITEYDNELVNNPDYSPYIQKFTFSELSGGGPDLVEEPQRPMYYYKIGTGNSSAPKILINAGIHAREWATCDAVLTFCIELLRAYKKGEYFDSPGFVIEEPDFDWDNDLDEVGVPYKGPLTFQPWKIPRDEVKRFIEETVIYVVPSSNPDGRDYSLSGGLLGGERWWRTNRRALGGSCGLLGLGAPPTGVDLNRNFDIAFNLEAYYEPSSHKAAKEATSLSPCGSTRKRNVYQGPSASSETETQNLQHLMTTLGITYYLDIHQALRAILIPWGVNSTQLYDSPDPVNTALNPNLDYDGVSGGREYNKNQDPTKYQEYFPDENGYGLHLRHYFLGAYMRDAVLEAAEGDKHSFKRSLYSVIQGAAGLYPTVGGSSDYALSACMQADGSGHAEIIPSEFPKFSLTLEAGHISDGEFFPLRAKNQYAKVEREIHCSLKGLLTHAVNVGRHATTKTPK